VKFSEKLILLRKRKGMTQEEFSRAVGVSRQSVYKWESGQSYPEAVKLLEIRRLYGISIDQLLDDTLNLPSQKERDEGQISAAPAELPEPPSPAPAAIEEAPPATEARPKEAKRPRVNRAEPQKEREAEVHSAPQPLRAAVTAPQKKKKKQSLIMDIVGSLWKHKK
jgi:transcriptional regulator with XRE-family HTH domain